MIIIKSDQEIDIMRTAGKVTAEILEKLESFIKPGVSTMDIDRFVEEFIRKKRWFHPLKDCTTSLPAPAYPLMRKWSTEFLPKKRTLQEGDVVRRRHRSYL